MPRRNGPDADIGLVALTLAICTIDPVKFHAITFVKLATSLDHPIIDIAATGEQPTSFALDRSGHPSIKCGASRPAAEPMAMDLL
jgi:hypothetical protein